MKIWEIEEGREFRIRGTRVTPYIKKDDGKLYYIRGCGLVESEAPFNLIVEKDFEYLPEKKYYLKLKPEMKFTDEFSYLVYAEFKEKFFISYNWKGAGYHTKFTEKEIAELIPPLWLTVCDRIEVKE